MAINPFILVKFVVSAAVIVAISEVSKRSTLLGALIASVPLVSILGMVWLYHDTGSTTAIIRLCTGVLWLLAPSAVIFIALIILLRSGVGFYGALFSALGILIALYLLILALARRLGINL